MKAKQGALDVAKLIIIAVLAWAAGLGAYLVCLGTLWGQSVDGELQPVMFWSGIALGLSAVMVYGPAMLVLRRTIAVQHWWFFSAMGIALGVVPMLILMVVFGGSPISPEAALFWCMFSAFGIVFGTGFYLACVRARM